eukprot:228699-Rhodomonas_salina.1
MPARWTLHAVCASPQRAAPFRNNIQPQTRHPRLSKPKVVCQQDRRQSTTEVRRQSRARNLVGGAPRDAAAEGSDLLGEARLGHDELADAGDGPELERRLEDRDALVAAQVAVDRRLPDLVLHLVDVHCGSTRRVSASHLAPYTTPLARF